MNVNALKAFRSINVGKKSYILVIMQRFDRAAEMIVPRNFQIVILINP